MLWNGLDERWAGLKLTLMKTALIKRGFHIYKVGTFSYYYSTNLGMSGAMPLWPRC